MAQRRTTHGVTITHAKPHTCSPATHFQARNTHAVQLLLPHHRAPVVDNPKISIKQIQSNERLQFHNTISYQQAYRVKEVVLQELWGDESECFAQFPEYIDRFKSADPQNRAYLDIGSVVWCSSIRRFHEMDANMPNWTSNSYTITNYM